MLNDNVEWWSLTEKTVGNKRVNEGMQKVLVPGTN